MNFGHNPTMDRFKILKELGDGTCGTVYKAVNKDTYEIVAVKKMKRKFYFWECMNLREVKSLRKLVHPNIIKLKEVVRENDELFFIFEYMECNLYQLMKERQRLFSEEEIRSFMTQILKGLAHMHKNGYFHRDMKPENLLVTNDVLKIADFGLAREVSSMPPYTDYVSTRWYRAPEVLLQSSSYTPAIDMWAVGAILAELFTLCPIFPGESEADQLYKICRVLGAPDWTAFPEAKNITQLISISYSEIMPANLSQMIPNASMEAIDFITRLCSWDPRQRPTAEESLRHPFFHVQTWVPRSIYEEYQIKPSNKEPNLELNLWDFDSKSEECSLGLTLAVKPSIADLDMVPSTSQRTGEVCIKSKMFWPTCQTVAFELFVLYFVLKKSTSLMQNILFSSGFHDHPEQSVFWSLYSPCRNGSNPPVESSLSLSFSTISHPPTGVAHPTGFTIASLQPSILDTSPFLAVPSSLQQSNYL